MSLVIQPAFQRVDWRKAGLGMAAVAVNVALLAALSFTSLGVRSRVSVVEPPLIYLDIEPRPLLPDERPRPTVEASAQPQTQSARARPYSNLPRPGQTIPTAPSKTQDRPSPVNPRVAAPAPQGVVAPDSQWTVSSDRSAAMARALRQGLAGCSNPRLLSRDEQRHCEDRRGQIARNAAPITGTGNPERDAAFARQGARRLAEWEMMNRPLSGGVGVLGPADCIGSNFGTGCAGAHLGDVPGVDMRQGAESTINRGERRRQGFSASIGGLRIGGKD